MVDGDASEGLFPMKVGERLRALREKAGLDLNDIGTRTRIPARHLSAIERSDYAALPSPTYAVGFVRSYARAIGADEAALASDVRDEIGRDQPGRGEREQFAPVDPARVPSRLLAWTAALLALAVVIGYGVWRTGYLGGDAVPVAAPVTVAAPAPPQAAPIPAPNATGQVVLTATSPVWLRVRDAGGATLIERELGEGESWSVPADADAPTLLTGRAEAIRVTIDGREVATLGPPATTVRDVGISAAALAARPTAPATPTVADPGQ